MQWQIKPHNVEKEASYHSLKIDRMTSRLLAQRDIDPERISEFMECKYSDIERPYNLGNVKEAVSIFGEVIKGKHDVGVIGDYDCDGICSSYMIKELCLHYKLKCDVFLPSRYEHGYGLNLKSIESIKQKFKTPPYLFFVLDCGTNSEKEIGELKKWGVKKVIVIDHHIIDNEKIAKSSDALINWHQCGFQETCTCGEVFQFIRGIKWQLDKKLNTIAFMPYAALGIIADMTPIIGFNRIVVRNGLKKGSLNNMTSFGLHGLIKTSYIYSYSLTQEDVSFKLAPKINAAGRLTKPDMALSLLLEQDEGEAQRLAQCLTDTNDKRKKIQKEICDQVIKQVQNNEHRYPYGILVFNPKWNIGIVGLAASKIVESFLKPAIVIGQHNGIWKGSGRSLEQINIKGICDSCSDLFEGYGGHEMACGVSVKNDMIEKANEIFNKACEKYYKDFCRPKGFKYYDLKVKPDTLNMDVAKKMRKTLYPYCPQNNPEPIFMIPGVTISNTLLKGDKACKKMTFNVSKNNVKCDLPLLYFSSEIGTEINGTTADIIVKLPQDLNARIPYLNVVDIIFKNNA